jgi:hypothetical protein
MVTPSMGSWSELARILLEDTRKQQVGSSQRCVLDLTRKSGPGRLMFKVEQTEFEHLLKAIGIDETPTPKKTAKSSTKTGKGKVIDPGQKNGILDFFPRKR